MTTFDPTKLIYQGAFLLPDAAGQFSEGLTPKDGNLISRIKIGQGIPFHLMEYTPPALSTTLAGLKKAAVAHDWGLIDPNNTILWPGQNPANVQNPAMRGLDWNPDQDVLMAAYGSSYAAGGPSVPSLATIMQGGGVLDTCSVSIGSEKCKGSAQRAPDALTAILGGYVLLGGRKTSTAQGQSAGPELVLAEDSDSSPLMSQELLTFPYATYRNPLTLNQPDVQPYIYYSQFQGRWAGNTPWRYINGNQDAGTTGQPVPYEDYVYTDLSMLPFATGYAAYDNCDTGIVIGDWIVFTHHLATGYSWYGNARSLACGGIPSMLRPGLALDPYSSARGAHCEDWTEVVVVYSISGQLVPLAQKIAAGLASPVDKQLQPVAVLPMALTWNPLTHGNPCLHEKAFDPATGRLWILGTISLDPTNPYNSNQTKTVCHQFQWTG